MCGVNGEKARRAARPRSYWCNARSPAARFDATDSDVGCQHPAETEPMKSTSFSHHRIGSLRRQRSFFSDGAAC
jgi:hypothetical protein